MREKSERSERERNCSERTSRVLYRERRAVVFFLLFGGTVERKERGKERDWERGDGFIQGRMTQCQTCHVLWQALSGLGWKKLLFSRDEAAIVPTANATVATSKYTMACAPSCVSGIDLNCSNTFLCFSFKLRPNGRSLKHYERQISNAWLRLLLHLSMLFWAFLPPSYTVFSFPLFLPVFSLRRLGLSWFLEVFFCQGENFLKNWRIKNSELE